MAKKPFNTTIEETLSKEFSKKCKSQGEKVTDITEALLSLYVNDKIEIKRKTTYEVIYKEDSK